MPRITLALCLAAFPALAAAQERPLFEAQPGAVMTAEAAFYENLVPVNHAIGNPPDLVLFRFEVFDVELYAEDGIWRWTEDFIEGTLAGDKSYSGLVEYGFYLVDPATLAIPVEVAFIGGAIGPDADIWQIGVHCAGGAECIEGIVRTEEDMSGWLDEILAEFQADPPVAGDQRAANYWWVEGEVEARRVAEALNIMLANAGAAPRVFD